MAVLIRDGQEIRGSIDAKRGLHDKLEFVFRPMLAEDVQRYDDLIGKANGKQFVAILCKIVVEQLVSWSEEEAVSFETVKRLPYPMLSRLSRIVRMLEPHDDIALTEEESEEMTRLLEQFGSSEAARLKN